MANPRVGASWASDLVSRDCGAAGSGTARFCSAGCPCPHGQADCDSDAECSTGLSCVDDVGWSFGAPRLSSVCLSAACEGFTPNTPGSCSVQCPCGYGGTYCENDTHCQAGLKCARFGTSFGVSRAAGVCVHSECSTNIPGTATFCSTGCPCGHGGGHCESDDECMPGLRCRPNTGGSFGMPATYSVCMRPSCNGTPGTPDFCTASCPCAAGGSCESKDECLSPFVCQSSVCKIQQRE